MLDTLYARNPTFLWENCCRRRNDQGFCALRRAAKIQNQDRYYPLDARQSFYDASFVFPPMQVAALVGAWSDWQATGSVYEFRSASLGAAYWHPDAPNGGNGGPVWSAQQKAQIKKAVATYKTKIRPLVRNADLYHIFPRPDGKHWDGIEYYEPAAKKGVVYLFKTVAGTDTVQVKLRGLRPDGRYRVSFEDGSNPAGERSGRELAGGIGVTLRGELASELMFFEEITPALLDGPMLIDECAKRLDRHEAFLERRPVERPLVRSWKSGYYPAEQFPSGTSRWRPGTILQPEDVSFAPFADDYQRLYESQRSDGDFGYVASAYWGIPWLEAIMGCPVTVATANCCAKPCLAGPDSACESRIEDTRIAGSQRLAQCATGHHRVPGAVGSRLFSCHVCGLARGDETAVDLDANRWLAAPLRFTRELVEFAAGRFPVCPPLLRGPGDAAAAMLGEMRYVTGFFDTPAAMRELLGLCARTRLAVVERLLAAIPTWASKGTVPFSSSRKSGQSPCNGIHVAGGYPSIVFSRRSVAYHQEDSAAVLNPTIFREFLLPGSR